MDKNFKDMILAESDPVETGDVKEYENRKLESKMAEIPEEQPSKQEALPSKSPDEEISMEPYQSSIEEKGKFELPADD